MIRIPDPFAKGRFFEFKDPAFVLACVRESERTPKHKVGRCPICAMIRNLMAEQSNRTLPPVVETGFEVKG